MTRRILKLKDLQARVPISRQHLWRMEQEGRFPKRIQLGPNSVGWFEDEIDGWLTERAKERA